MADDDYPKQYAAAFEPPLSDGAAILRNAFAVPTDHLPSLVLADWLEEHDHPAVAEIIRRKAEELRGSAVEGWHLPQKFKPAGWTGYHVPPNMPEGEPSAYLATNTVQHRRGRTTEERPAKTVGVGALFRVGGQVGVEDPHPAFYGISTTPEDAHRLLSAMPNVRNADKAIQHLEAVYPHLRQPAE